MSTSHLLEIKLPNVSMEKVLQEEIEEMNGFKFLGAFLSKNMHEFIQTVALKHPEWSLEAVRVKRNREENKTFYVIASAFKVYQNKTLLGFLSEEYSYGRSKFMYKVQREKRAQNTTNPTQTSDPKKAAKNADKILRPLTAIEKFDYEMAHSLNTLDAVHMRVNRDVNRHFDANKDNMMEFIANNIEAFVQTYDAPVEAKKQIEKFLLAKEEVEILEELARNVNQNTLIKVLQEGDIYYVRDTEQTFFTHELKDLSEDVKYKLGILKLVEVGQAVTNVGFRGRANFFIITS